MVAAAVPDGYGEAELSAGSNLPQLTPDHALFLDFDGTLAGFQDDPDLVVLPEGGVETLAALSDFLGGALCLISGRSVVDLSRRVPADFWRAGGHGMDQCAPGEAPDPAVVGAPATLRDALDGLIAPFDGVRREDKGRVQAIHYRQAPQLRDELGDALSALIKGVEGYKLQAGKNVYEAKPLGADKGTGLRQIMQRAPFRGRVPVMLGDDVTDEDAFRVVLDMGGEAIKVGEGDTVAAHRLADPDAVWGWLRIQEMSEK